MNEWGDNGGYQMYAYLQCEFATKTFYKQSVFVVSIPISNY